MPAETVFGEGSPQRRRLGSALRRLRVDAGLTGEQLAERAGMSQSKVSRIELGQSVPAIADVERWARETGASDELRAELVALAEATATHVSLGRKAERRGLPRLQQETRELEATAATIRNFQPVLVPGLLQTAEYARRLFTASLPAGSPDLAAWLAARMERQAILYDEAKRLEFVIAEAALRWRLGPPQVMLAQLDRIDVVATLANVAIGLIPLASEVTVWHSHGFNLFEDRGDGDPIVHVETLTADLTISDPDDVERYREAFARLREAAVSGDEAEALLRALMTDLRQSSI